MADVTVSVEQQIVDLIRNLNEEQRWEVLRFARRLKLPPGISGKEFIERTRAIQFPHEDLEEMKRAIEEEFEQIDDNWDRPIFSD